MTAPLPRPQGTQPIRCPNPACEHPIDQHHPPLAVEELPMYRPMNRVHRTWCLGCIQDGKYLSRQPLPCSWTPNDIAWALLFGELSTPTVARAADHT